MQPLALRGQVPGHAATFVGAQSIPDQYDALTTEMPRAAQALAVSMSNVFCSPGHRYLVEVGLQPILG